MEDLDRTGRNILRNVVMKAEDDEVITQEEAGFVITLTEKFRSEIEKKIKQIHVLQGEINQLRSNENTIISLINNMIAAQERNKARNETIERIRNINNGEEVPTEDYDTAEDELKQ